MYDRLRYVNSYCEISQVVSLLMLLARMLNSITKPNVCSSDACVICYIRELFLTTSAISLGQYDLC